MLELFAPILETTSSSDVSVFRLSRLPYIFHTLLFELYVTWFFTSEWTHLHSCGMKQSYLRINCTEKRYKSTLQLFCKERFTILWKFVTFDLIQDFCFNFIPRKELCQDCPQQLALFSLFILTLQAGSLIGRFCSQPFFWFYETHFYLAKMWHKHCRKLNP